MLFDLEADPHETTNLAAHRTDLLGVGLQLMDRWMGEQMSRVPQLAHRGDPSGALSERVDPCTPMRIARTGTLI